MRRHLTRQLLTFSRKQVVQPRVVDLHVELPQIRTLLSRLMPETIAVEAAIDGEVWPIEIDPVQLTQVLINLAINGRDAMPRGGRLSVHVSNRVLRYLDTLAPGDTPPGDYVELAVTDNGVGLSRPGQGAAVRAVLHHQGRRPGHRTRPGHVVDHRHRGRRLHPRRRAPRAGRDVPRLPAARHRGRRSGAAPSTTRPRAARRPASTALVVEDNDAVRATLVELLGANGYEVVAAIDGEQALEIVARRAGAVRLPRHRHDAARHERPRRRPRTSTTRWPACRVLFITGYLDLVLRNALPPGASLLQKPFSLRALLGELDKLRGA